MKRSLILGSATALLSALALIACSSTPTQRSAGETVDDSVLTSKVKTALVDNDVVKAGEVNVETYKGVVQLNGTVDTQAEKARRPKPRRASLASRKCAITSRSSRPRWPRTGLRVQVVDDATITGKVKTKLIEDETDQGAPNQR